MSFNLLNTKHYLNTEFALIDTITKYNTYNVTVNTPSILAYVDLFLFACIILLVTIVMIITNLQYMI